MGDWQTMTGRFTVVGPRWRDRVRAAWKILRGQTRLNFSFSFQVKSLDVPYEILVDAVDARLVGEFDDDEG